MVGTSGNAGARWAPKQASGLSLPAFICDCAAAIEDTSTCALLPSDGRQRGPAAVGRQVLHLDARPLMNSAVGRCRAP